MTARVPKSPTPVAYTRRLHPSTCSRGPDCVLLNDDQTSVGQIEIGRKNVRTGVRIECLRCAIEGLISNIEIYESRNRNPRFCTSTCTH